MIRATKATSKYRRIGSSTSFVGPTQAGAAAAAKSGSPTSAARAKTVAPVASPPVVDAAERSRVKRTQKKRGRVGRKEGRRRILKSAMLLCCCSRQASTSRSGEAGLLGSERLVPRFGHRRGGDEPGPSLYCCLNISSPPRPYTSARVVHGGKGWGADTAGAKALFQPLEKPGTTAVARGFSGA